MEQPAGESSFGERNLPAAFSTQASMDSTSQMVSEAANIPPEDLGLQDIQESLLPVDLSSCSVTHKGAANQSCSSLDYSIRYGLHRTYSQGSPDEDVGICGRISVDRAQEHETWPRSRSSDCSSENFGTSEKDSCSSAWECKASPPLKPRRMCCGVFSQPAASQTYHTRCSVPVHTLPHGCPERMVRKRSKEGRVSSIVRSTSDPLSCSSTLEVPVSSPLVAASACQESANRFLPAGKPRDPRKADLSQKPKPLETLSKERPHSLVDLQTYKDTKILVAKFLEHSNCNLPPEVRHVVNSIRSVIKSDERHMEEAIFSANIIDQVIMSSQQNVDTSRKRLQEDLHLQSCGALSSPVAFLHQVHIRDSLERGRPHSLIGVCRETIL